MIMRTSQSHPLQIAAVDPGPGMGQIGITFCPGKKQQSAMTGGWDRDLDLDLDQIEQWGTAALVTLIEPHEMRVMGVQQLGAVVATRHMDWLHLPIRDVSIPGPDFERVWEKAGAGLRARLRDGFNVVVHCKGGLGRAGTIAARLLVELGSDPERAIRMVRRVRPGALETAAQEAYVRSLSKAVEQDPPKTPGAIRDRAIGALIGLAIGDAVGTTLEFAKRDSKPRLTDMVGGGPFHLAPGQWTDDTSMALALADSLLANPELDASDLMTRFVSWRDQGSYSCTGRCFDIGLTVSAALRRWERTGDPLAGSTNPTTAGNGSLMRLSPVAIRHWQDREALRRVAAKQSVTTHAAPEAVSACMFFADMIADAIDGKPRADVMSPRHDNYAGLIQQTASGSWRGRRRDDVQSSGYVAHSLEAALWSIGRTGDFPSAVLTAANLAGDADTTAAIAGQLAGALYGQSAIPDDWRDRLACREQIEKAARSLFPERI